MFRMIILWLCFAFFSPFFPFCFIVHSTLVFPTHYLMLPRPSVGYFDDIPHLKIWQQIFTLAVLVLITQVCHLNILKILGKLLSFVSGISSKSKICLT